MKNKRDSAPPWRKILIAVAVIGALAAAWRYTPLSELITPQRIAGWARAARDLPWTPPLIVFAYTPASFVMFPRPLLTLFAVIAFGVWLGFLYSMAGMMVAALATYYLGRALPHSTVKRIGGQHMDHISKRLRSHGLLAVLAMRMAPVTPFPVDGLIAGAARISLSDYTIGSFLGFAPGLLATTVFATQIAHAFEDTSRINYWVIGGVIVFFIFTTYGVGRWLSKKQS